MGFHPHKDDLKSKTTVNFQLAAFFVEIYMFIAMQCFKGNTRRAFEIQFGTVQSSNPIGSPSVCHILYTRCNRLGLGSSQCSSKIVFCWSIPQVLGFREFQWNCDAGIFFSIFGALGVPLTSVGAWAWKYHQETYKPAGKLVSHGYWIYWAFEVDSDMVWCANIF